MFKIVLGVLTLCSAIFTHIDDQWCCCLKCLVVKGNDSKTQKWCTGVLCYVMLVHITNVPYAHKFAYVSNNMCVHVRTCMYMYVHLCWPSSVHVDHGRLSASGTCEFQYRPFNSLIFMKPFFIWCKAPLFVNILFTHVQVCHQLSLSP